MEKKILLGSEVEERMESLLSRYGGKKGFVQKKILGKSFLGAEIPMLIIGDGGMEEDRAARKVRPPLPTALYVAGHHALETVCSEVLLRFAEDLCASIAASASVYRIRCDYLRSYRRICILPLLNPDGAQIAAGKLSAQHPLYERILKMNGGRGDFSTWQANGRGVDLNHNYAAGFAAYKPLEAQMGLYGGAPTRYSGEFPESEEETAALCAWLRRQRPRCTLTLHSQGEELYCGNREIRTAGAENLFSTAARMTGYRKSEPQGPASYGGLTEWMLSELSLPCLTLECGRGKNPLPLGDASLIYGRLRRFFFTVPTLFGARTVMPSLRR